MFERKEPFKKGIHAVIIMIGVTLLGFLYLFISLGPDKSYDPVFWGIMTFIFLFMMILCFYYAYKLDVKNQDEEKIQRNELIVRLVGVVFVIPFIFSFLFTVSTIEDERLLYALVAVILAIEILNLVLYILDLVKTDDRDRTEIE